MRIRIVSTLVILTILLTGCIDDNTAEDSLYKIDQIIGDTIYEKSLEVSDKDDRDYNETFNVLTNYQSLGIKLVIDVFSSYGEVEVIVKNPDGTVVYNQKASNENPINNIQKVESVKGTWKVRYKNNEAHKRLNLKIIGDTAKTTEINETFEEGRKHDYVKISLYSGGWDKLSIRIKNPKGEAVYQKEIISTSFSEERTVNSEEGVWTVEYVYQNWTGFVVLKITGVIKGRD